MNEPTVTRGAGQDVAWPGRQPAGRVDLPHPDLARPDASNSPRPTPLPAPLPGDAPAAPERIPAFRDGQADATFPQSYARFSVNEKTHQITIKIVDAITDEVLREIPSEEVQRIAEDLQALARRNSIGKRPQPSEPVASGGVDRYV
jgi:hypothetical protein